ncbi:unnamed protein product [Cladocopium goreaui]|uniref:Uncharacterized protein n=1 Tax=Cladocopium goreaui TaxID=2562237 RepID=A0A9P1FZ82_9DINO|nr:unnamed protein product [Cladocopium goreaui]
MFLALDTGSHWHGWDTMSAIASDTVGVVTTGCQKWLEQKQSIHLTCTELNGPKLPEHNKPQ